MAERSRPRAEPMVLQTLEHDGFSLKVLSPIPRVEDRLKVVILPEVKRAKGLVPCIGVELGQNGSYVSTPLISVASDSLLLKKLLDLKTNSVDRYLKSYASGTVGLQFLGLSQERDRGSRTR